MKLKGHLFWTFLYIFIIAYFLEPTAIALIFIVTFVGTLPDVDWGLFRKETKDKEKEFVIVDTPHRWWLTHSLIFPGLAYVFYPNILTLLILLAIGHHLALDTVGNLIFGKKATGYYTICIIPSIEFNFWLFRIRTKSYRLSGKLTTIYLLGNWIITLIVLVVVIL